MHKEIIIEAIASVVEDAGYSYTVFGDSIIVRANNDVVEYLANYKHDMEIRSGAYFVKKLIREQKPQLEIDSETIEDFIYNEGYELADKLDWDKIADILIEKHEKENQDD